MIKAAIFDLDGTLCYTIDDLMTGMNGMMREMGYRECTKEIILSAINYGSREFVRRSLPEGVGDDEELLDKCLECYIKHYNMHCLEKTYPYEGIVELLASLKGRGIRLGCLSNKGDKQVKEIINHLLPDTFEIAMGNTGDFPTKPDPTSALYVASMLDAKPEEVLYIGDSNIDMMTANNAGFYACGVTWGYRDAQCLLESGAQALVDKAADIELLID